MKKKVLLAIVMVSLILSVVLTFQTAGATIRTVLDDTANEIEGVPNVYLTRDASGPVGLLNFPSPFYCGSDFTPHYMRPMRIYRSGLGQPGTWVSDSITISPFKSERDYRNPYTPDNSSEELAMARFEADYLGNKNLTPFQRRWYGCRAAEGASLTPSCDKIQFNGYPGFYSEFVMKGRSHDTVEFGQVYTTWFSFTMEWVCGRHIFKVHREGNTGNYDGMPISSDPVRDWADVLFRNAQKYGLCVGEGVAQDSDGDGVPDDVDACPETPAGVAVDDKGCPIGMQLSVSVSASPAELPADGKNQSIVTAIVTNATDSPVVGANVTFTLDKVSLGNIEPLIAKTNESGMATATFTSGTTPGIVIVTATETETGLSGTVEIILGGIKIDITTSTSKFVPTPCQTATIYFEIKPELVRDSPETNVSMIIKDKNGELVYNSSEDADAQVSKITAIWIGKNTTGEPVNPQLSNYTVEIIVNYRNMTINDTHNVTVLPNKVIVVVDEERMKAVYNANDVDNLMTELKDYCCRNKGTLYNLTKVRHDFNSDSIISLFGSSAFKLRNQPDRGHWYFYPRYVEGKLEKVTKFMTQNNTVSILLVGNDNVIPYHRMSAILTKWEDDDYKYIPGNVLWSDFPYSEITGDNNLDVPVMRLEGNPKVMKKQLESTKTQYKGKKALLAIKWGKKSTRVNDNILRINLIYGWGLNVFYYNETQGLSVADKK